jgi:lipoyl(octanoyl) transferase
LGSRDPVRHQPNVNNIQPGFLPIFAIQPFHLDKQRVIFEDLGVINYKSAWDYQELLVKTNLEIKAAARKQLLAESYDLAAESSQRLATDTISSNVSRVLGLDTPTANPQPSTTNHLLFCEHPPVYTLGKSGNMENVLLTENEMEEKEIEFFKTNRGGDITFHGLQQVVGYPILDLEKFSTDIGKYLRSLEEVIIVTIADYGIKGDRSKGETGVWIEPGVPARERKICAMGIRCSRWITMHGFALNVNTDLSYFNNIIPCGIVNKQVTSVEREVGHKVDFPDIKKRLISNFEKVFNVVIT